MWLFEDVTSPDLSLLPVSGLCTEFVFVAPLLQVSGSLPPAQPKNGVLFVGSFGGAVAADYLRLQWTWVSALSIVGGGFAPSFVFQNIRS